MLINRKSVSQIASLLCISALALTGCRSGGFTKPDMSKLAFWRSSDDVATNTVPPPPARHFNPASMDKAIEDTDTQVVDLDNSSLQRSIDRGIDATKNRFDSTADSINNSLDTKVAGLPRKPYSADLSNNDKKAFGDADLTTPFSSAANQVRSKLDNFSPDKVNDGLSAAQRDFQAAMNQSKDTAAAGLSNGLEKAKATASGMAGGWKEINLAQSAENARNNFDQSLSSVNQSFSNANAKVAGALGNSAQQAKELAAPFRAGLDNAANTVANNASNTFAGFQPPSFQPAAPTATSPQASSATGNDSVQAEVAAARQQIELLKQQVAEAQQKAAMLREQATLKAAGVSQANAQLAQSNGAPQSGFASRGGGPFGSAQATISGVSATSGSVDASASSGLANDLQQLAQATIQPPATPAGASASPSSQPIGQTFQPSAPTAKPTFSSNNSNTGFGGFGQLGSKSTGGFNPPASANVLRTASAADASPPTNTFNQQPISRPTASPAGLQIPAYPATPHGGFSPNSQSAIPPSPNGVPNGASQGNLQSTPQGSQFNGFSPLNLTPPNVAPAAQVGFNTTGNTAQVVNTGAAPNDQGFASRIQNYENDVVIPDAILKGSGTYSPGSVRSLNSNK